VKLFTHKQYLGPEMHTSAQQKHSTVQAEYVIFSANSVVNSNPISSGKGHTSPFSEEHFQPKSQLSNICHYC